MKKIETYYLNKIVRVLQEGYSHALLKEAVPYSIVKDYLKIKRSSEVESLLLLSVFSKLKSLPNATQLDKKGYRIAFPFNMKGGEVQDKSPIESEIDSLIQKHGFKVKDYFKGLAFDEKNKRDIKIGKVLNIVSKKDKKAEQLLNKFNTDTKRTQTKSADEKLIVFSYHPYDIAGMTAGRDWTSCMDVISGSNSHYVYVDIEKGTCIAYIIDKEDTNIKKPLARILIKPYLNVEDQKDTLLYPEEQVYGQIPNEGKFISFVDDTMEKVQKMSGTYKRLRLSISDSGRETVQDKETTLKIAKGKLESNDILDDREYKVLPDNLKQLYIEKIVKLGRKLSNPQYEDASNNLKQLYIEKRIEAGFELSNPQYEASPDNIKQFYIEKIVEAGRWIIRPSI
jgi:hypothetical protein